ncbi:helix-turn-helix protein [Kribbella voronezhensis]|uniref:Helix-turn-helix protein n=1 Tax=Kribbella voronezhensis TaxID=2512212 RepID=A0A4R7TJ70_9ACTN|nr:winged helix-turn-helix domain-containing protein [Kribbella voronezhensis]TDU91587.1 helix-turn-helix protein [Kribbella voronezhensis]
MLRIHFTAEDFARTTLAPGPDPMWEILHSLHMLQVEDGPIAYGAWRQRMRRRLPRETVGAVTAPATGVGEFDDAVDRLLAVPRERFRTDLAQLTPRRSSVGWVRQLSEARPESLHRLRHAIRVYHQSALVPYWPSLKAAVQADQRHRLDQLTSGGIAAVLEGVHPQARWRDQVLEIAAFQDSDLRLNGRGLRLQPSYFCWRQPTKLADQELPPVLVFPIRNATGLVHSDGATCANQEQLAALVGRTRATVLALTVNGTTTTQLAEACGITLATASHQTAVLREAGLIESHRRGKSVVHLATRLGRALLEGSPAGPGDTVMHESRLPHPGPDHGP